MTDMESPGRAASIGVDGGAGALKFAVRRPDSTVVHYECAGANPSLIGMIEFLSRLSQGIHDALSTAGCTVHDVASAGFALSGVDRPNEISLLKEKIPTRILPSLKKIWVGNDALAALRCGAGRLRGLVLIAGTGSICFAVAADGRSGRVGGWGGELGDEGSGFWIGQRGLQIACRMADGRLGKTHLMDRILIHLGLPMPEDLIPWSSGCTREEFKKQTASLYRIMAEEAARGDNAAKQAISLGIGHLVHHAVVADRLLKQLERQALREIETQHGMTTIGEEKTQDGDREPENTGDKTKLVCAGGLFVNDEHFYEIFINQLKHQRDYFDPIRLTEPASLGALALGEEARPSVA